MITVHNKKHEPMDPRSHSELYIGRGSMWGNPFAGSGKPSAHDVIRVASVTESVERYREYIQDALYRDERMRVGMEALVRQYHRHGVLRLFCFCKPGPCHGDVLAEIVKNWPR